MGILSGFKKTKRYRKLESGEYQLQSEWTSSDTVEFGDGETLTNKMSTVENTLSTHTHNASNVKAGTLGGQVVAPAGTDYTTNRLRNQILVTNDPGAGVSTGYANGSIISVYE